jgi:hypothetical protein
MIVLKTYVGSLIEILGMNEVDVGSIAQDLCLCTMQMTVYD